MTEEDQLIFVPDCSKAQVHTKVVDQLIMKFLKHTFDLSLNKIYRFLMF